MASGNRRVFVVGVGMTKFEKPGRREDFDYPQMALEAGNNALKDAGISYDKIEQACVGYCFGDSTCGQRAVYQFGLTGIPVYNLSNACATGSTALMLGRQLIEGGLAECVLTLGFEKMDRGPIKGKFSDRAGGMDKHLEIMTELRDITSAPINPQFFGNAGREHMEKYGTKPEHFAKIAYKNHKHSTNNPNSQFQKYYSMEEIMKSPMIYEPLTLLQCCPTSDGGGAAILASEEFVRRNGLEAKAVEIVAQAMATDLPATFTEKSCLNLVGYGMTKKAAEMVYNKAGIRPDDVDVIELHDCFSANELITYEALGLCDPGKAGEFIDRGDNTYGGKYVINPSGGLISKGHPLGATGLAQCTELSWQLRGLAGKRQVPGAKLALQHNVGLGGAVVVTLYRMGFPEATQSVGRILPNQTAALKKTDLKSSMVFAAIAQELERNGEAYVKPIKGSFCVKVTKGNDVGSWLINLKEGKGSVEFNSDKKGDVTVTLSDEDFIKMGSGQVNPQQAFFQGKLKISGNMMLLMKVRNLQGQVEKDFGVKAKL